MPVAAWDLNVSLHCFSQLGWPIVGRSRQTIARGVRRWNLFLGIYLDYLLVAAVAGVAQNDGDGDGVARRRLVGSRPPGSGLPARMSARAFPNSWPPKCPISMAATSWLQGTIRGAPVDDGDGPGARAALAASAISISGSVSDSSVPIVVLRASSSAPSRRIGARQGWRLQAGVWLFHRWCKWCSASPDGPMAVRGCGCE